MAEGFFSRWSRRKLDAKEPPAPASGDPLAQAPDAPEAGRRRQPDAGGERQVRDLVVALKDREDLSVDGIQHRWLRRSGPRALCF